MAKPSINSLRSMLGAIARKFGWQRPKLDYPSRPTDRIEDVPDIAMWGGLMSTDPLIINTASGGSSPFGLARLIGPLLHRHPVHFLMYPTYAWELTPVADHLVRMGRAHRKAFPLHKFTFVCSNAAQEKNFARSGFPALTINWNIFQRSSVFRPLPDVAPRFDAVYNARLSAMKRHELAALVGGLELIYFRDPGEHTPEQFHAEHARLRALMPLATFVNPLTADGCAMMPAEAVNRALNEARVGLCLSAVEGQMRASLEYMLAGLAVVSTASLGGREYFFDDEFCALVADDPRAIRDATRAMIARNIPRDHIRARTMERVARERARFVDFIQQLIERSGGGADFSARFPALLDEDKLLPWTAVRPFVKPILEALGESDVILL
jgi:glycosyltransferase involved in cell wall biosynthesis